MEVIAKLQEAARKAQADAARLEAGGAAELEEEEDGDAIGDEDAAEQEAEDAGAADGDGGCEEAAGAGTSGAVVLRPEICAIDCSRRFCFTHCVTIPCAVR